jgi:hypothetical protein
LMPCAIGRMNRRGEWNRMSWVFKVLFRLGELGSATMVTNQSENRFARILVANSARIASKA